jgi:ligand-binding sensor domain-containing protein
MRTSVILPSILSLFVAWPSHSQWVQSSTLDSVRHLATGDVNRGDFSTTAIVAGRSGGVPVSSDGGASWTMSAVGMANSNVLSVLVAGLGIFAGTTGGVYKSASGGTTWLSFNSGLDNLTVRALAASHPYQSNARLFAGTDGGIFVSTVNGTSWTSSSAGLTSLSVRALAIVGSKLLAGTNGGVFMSTDSGINWSPANTGLTNLSVRALVVSGSNIFAGTDAGVFLSTSTGSNWTAINSGLTNLNVRTFAAVGADVFAGSDSGVFRTSDNGASWIAVNAGLTSKAVHALALFGFGSAPNVIFTATDNGIWRRPLSEITTSLSFRPQQAPLDFRINPSGSISFTLTDPTRVKLTAHSPSGQKVAVLLAEELPAGSYTRRVDAEAATLPNGVYVYRLRVGDATESRTIARTR